MTKVAVISVCAVTAVAGLAGGYALRAATGGASESDRDARGRAGPAGYSTKSAPREPSRVGQVRSNVERSRGSRHWLHWMAGVEDASLSELPGLARLAHDNPAALRLIAYRWVELDAAHLFKTLVTESRHFDANAKEPFPITELSRHLFEEWPKQDLDGALEALSGSSAIVGQDGLRHNVLNRIIVDDPKLGIELMAKWGIHNYGPSTKGVAEWARRDPAAAAQAVLDYPVGYGAQHCLKAITEVWGETDPEAAIEFAAQARGSLSGTMRELVLAQWAGRDLEAASEWLAAQDDEALRAHLSPFLVEAWAKDDPEGALAWCRENLDGHRLLTAVTKLAKGAAERDVRAAADLVGGMAASPARTQAAVAVAEAWFPQSWPSNQQVEPEAIEWLRAIDDRELQGAVLDEVAWGWSTQDRDSLMEFLASEHAAQASASPYRVLMNSLARDDPQRALEWAETLPPERRESVASSAFSTWIDHQPAAAAAWLAGLQPGDPRRASLTRTYVSTSLWQPESIAMQRLASLPPFAHAEARAQIEQAGLPEANKERLRQALEQRD